MFSAMTFIITVVLQRVKLQKFIKDLFKILNKKMKEKLSRTQELNAAKVQALRELGYDSINEENAKEVLEKIAEIQSRKV